MNLKKCTIIGNFWLAGSGHDFRTIAGGTFIGEIQLDIDTGKFHGETTDQRGKASLNGFFDKRQIIFKKIYHQPVNNFYSGEVEFVLSGEEVQFPTKDYFTKGWFGSFSGPNCGMGYATCIITHPCIS